MTDITADVLERIDFSYYSLGHIVDEHFGGRVPLDNLVAEIDKRHGENEIRKHWYSSLACQYPGLTYAERDWLVSIGHCPPEQYGQASIHAPGMPLEDRFAFADKSDDPAFWRRAVREAAKYNQLRST